MEDVRLLTCERNFFNFSIPCDHVTVYIIHVSEPHSRFVLQWVQGSSSKYSIKEVLNFGNLAIQKVMVLEKGLNFGCDCNTLKSRLACCSLSGGIRTPSTYKYIQSNCSITHNNFLWIIINKIISEQNVLVIKHHPSSIDTVTEAYLTYINYIMVEITCNIWS